jgi:hypothetical protein
MDFITCHHRKSWPTISTAVCEKCKRLGRCTDYHHHINPLLFPDLPEQAFTKYKPTRRNTKGEHNDAIGPEQLTFDLQFTKK